MSASQLVVADVVAALLLVVLGGILAMGRAGLSRSFVLYLAFTLTSNRLVSWWPEIFFTQRWWTVKELIQGSLVVAVAMEMALSLRSFGRARWKAVCAVLGIVIVTMAGVSESPSGGYRAWLGTLVSGAHAGAAWACLAVVMVFYWYRLPMRPWHRMIALGFFLYGGVYTVALAAVGHFGWSLYPYLAALDPLSYASTVGLWAFASWRMEWYDLPATARRKLAGEAE